MSRRISFLLCLLGVAFPLFASAKQMTTWDFVHKNAGQWDIAGLDDVTEQSDGIHIQTSHDGAIVHTLEHPQSIDALKINFASTPPNRINFLWKVQGAKSGDTIQQLPLSSSMAWVDGNSIVVDLTIAPAHIGTPEMIGFVFPAGTQTTIQTISSISYNFGEKILGGWLSFWKFNDFGPRTINFLWEPILRFTPEGRTALFLTEPPVGWSSTVFLTELLGIVGICIMLWIVLRGGEEKFRRGASAFFSFALCLWILFDIRMGSELLRNVGTDVQSYLLQQVGNRKFRVYGNFYDALLSSVPALQQKPRFAAMSDPSLQSRILYETYPSRPIENGESIVGVTTWFVYQQPDITVDEKGDLRSGDTILAKGGRILQRFDSTSFLYQTP